MMVVIGVDAHKRTHTLVARGRGRPQARREDGRVADLDYMARGGSSVTANLGTGVGTSVLEAVAAVSAATGRSIAIDVRARRPGDVPAIWADPTLAATVLGWRARRGISAITESAWRWHTAHPRGFDSARADQR